MEHKGFPKLQKRINDFLLEEEGTIPRSKIITVGTMLLLLSVFFVNDAFATHRSHSSHGSHGSHSSHRSGSYHRSHVSHTSHRSSSHGSHSNHSNHGSHASHSNHSNHSSATAVPIPNNLSLPEVPELNLPGTISGVSGFSLNPVATTDPNIVLTRYSGAETSATVNATTAGISADSIASGVNIQALEVGAIPKNMGSIPISSGIVLPDPASLNIQGSESNTFSAEIQDIEIKPAQDVPAMKKIEFGTQPKSNGKPIE